MHSALRPLRAIGAALSVAGGAIVFVHVPTAGVVLGVAAGVAALILHLANRGRDR